MKQSIFADQFGNVVTLVASGFPADAATALRKISQIGTQRGSAAIPRAREAAILARDQYTCRYCGFRLISIPVMRAISLLFPQDFKYHANWKASDCDVAYWRDSTSIDHVVPATRNGSSVASNLVTSCWPCNISKGNLLLSELSRELLPISDLAWDGLSGSLGGLVASMTSPLPYFRSWLAAINLPETLT
jgi:5-methylcytosine-specific restriction endonuclease McrA